MKVYQFVPVAALFIAGACAVANKIGAPIAPIALIGALGAFGVVLQLEDHKWGDFLAEVVHAFTPDHHGTKHHA